ncbi:MAG: hypothetical protein AAF587_44840, partial [Bacteroidota bacterium]
MPFYHCFYFAVPTDTSTTDPSAPQDYTVVIIAASVAGTVILAVVVVTVIYVAKRVKAPVEVPPHIMTKMDENVAYGSDFVPTSQSNPEHIYESIDLPYEDLGYAEPYEMVPTKNKSNIMSNYDIFAMNELHRRAMNRQRNLDQVEEAALDNYPNIPDSRTSPSTQALEAGVAGTNEGYLKPVDEEDNQASSGQTDADSAKENAQGTSEVPADDQVVMDSEVLALARNTAHENDRNDDDEDKMGETEKDLAKDGANTARKHEYLHVTDAHIASDQVANGN